MAIAYSLVAHIRTNPIKFVTY